MKPSLFWFLYENCEPKNWTWASNAHEHLQYPSHPQSFDAPYIGLVQHGVQIYTFCMAQYYLEPLQQGVVNAIRNPLVNLT
mmetsp:Transcript_137146/g.238503  ORF Transcript_137146/g.238503 Transcript_137146/m.238503 type:complete len:81 (-) Transcript_137146:3715-3957(-)